MEPTKQCACWGVRILAKITFCINYADQLFGSKVWPWPDQLDRVVRMCDRWEREGLVIVSLLANDTPGEI